MEFCWETEYTPAETLRSGPDLEGKAAPDLGPIYKDKNPTKSVTMIHSPEMAQITCYTRVIIFIRFTTPMSNIRSCCDIDVYSIVGLRYSNIRNRNPTNTK